MSLDRSYLGRCLTPAERVYVRNSMQKLALNESFEEIVFWGKIFGDQKDYIILKATNTHLKLQKKYYFSEDGGVTMSELPVIDEFVRQKASLYHGAFTGNPGELLKDQIFHKDSAEDEEEENGENEEGSGVRHLTELERLSYNVSAIDNDTSVVPRGAFMRNAANDLVRDTTFKGLRSSELPSLRNYEHFRQSQSPENLLEIRRAEIRSSGSLLDSLEGDVPKHAWAVHVHESGQSASLRSLQWPGYEFQLEANSEDSHRQGAAYFGDGQRNHDVNFAI